MFALISAARPSVPKGRGCRRTRRRGRWFEPTENAYPVGDVDDDDVAVRANRDPCTAGTDAPNTKAHRGSTPSPVARRWYRATTPSTSGMPRREPSVVAAAADERLALRRQRPVFRGIATPTTASGGSARNRRRRPVARRTGRHAHRDTRPLALLVSAALVVRAEHRIRSQRRGMSGNNCHTRIVVCQSCSHDLQRGYARSTPAPRRASGGGRGPGPWMRSRRFRWPSDRCGALTPRVNPASDPQQQGQYADRDTKPPPSI